MVPQQGDAGTGHKTQHFHGSSASRISARQAPTFPQATSPLAFQSHQVTLLVV